METWKFIMENGNSLKRYCNLAVFFDQLLRKHCVALKEAQEAFRGEAERVGLKDEQDVVDMIKAMREEKD